MERRGIMAAEKSMCNNEREFVGQLSDELRRMYDSIPEDLDYVPNTDFRKASMEGQLFGPDAEVVPVARWRQYPDVEEDLENMPKVRTQLTRKQEAHLFMQYNYARWKLAKLSEAQAKRFSARRAKEILTWYQHSLNFRSALANANMALVVAMAKRTRINSVEFGELVSEGNMALLRAVDKFDVARGFKFSTYACRAILKGFNRLATKTGVYRQHFPTEFDPEMERSDELTRRHTDQRELAIEDLQRVLLANLASLSDVERTVVGARFAVAGQRQVRTLEQVGRLVGLSKERVRQVQNEALAKLRAALGDQAA
jgi:RNA polymerase primary sigma factor